MSIIDSVKNTAFSTAVNTVLDYLEKDPEANIPKAMSLMDKVLPDGWYEGQRAAFRRAIEDRGNWYQLIMKAYQLDEGVRKTFFQNFIVNSALKGTAIQNEIRKKENCNVVVNGDGSAGIAITKLLLLYGFKHVTICGINGILSKSSPDLNWMQKEMMEVTNLEQKTGLLSDAMKGADIFIGVSAPNIVSEEMVASMNQDAILFAMANPVPEIMPDVAKKAGARIVGTGRSDFPNQVNNVVAFPGIFKGALESRASQITDEMKLAAANAIANLVDEKDLNDENILPEAFDPRVADVVANAVKAYVR